MAVGQRPRRGGERARMNRPLLNRRLAGAGTTIFAEMSALAVATGSINLGQGFPDNEGPDDVRAKAADALMHGSNQYPPMLGLPELRRAGPRSYDGLCPFHEERTPSFSVNPTDKLFYCFGCHQKGDMIRFVQEIQGLDFVGAVEWLAESVNP